MRWLLAWPKTTSYRLVGRYDRLMVPFPSSGFAYIAAALEARGAEVRIHDEFASPGATLEERLAEWRPDVVGLSCLTPSLKAVCEAVPEIRAAAPNAKIVVGNLHASIYHREMVESGIADIVVRGEAEETVVDLDACLNDGRDPTGVLGVTFRVDGGVVANPDRETPADLDALAPPAWRLFDVKKYVTPPVMAERRTFLPVSASRGCPFKCTFCAQNVLSPRLRKRNMDAVAAEIENVHGRFGVDRFWFTDAIFPLNRADAEVFCSGMVKRGLHRKIRWITETRAELVDRELLRMMKEAGLKVLTLGLESGSEKVLAGIKPGMSPDKGARAVAAAAAEGVLSWGLFIVGMPGETAATIEETIDYSKRIGLDFAKYHRAVPFPGSAFYNSLDIRVTPENAEKFSSWYELKSPDDELIYTPDGVSSKDLVALQRRALFEFYVRPSLILKLIFKRAVSPRNLALGGWLIVKNFFETKWRSWRK